MIDLKDISIITHIRIDNPDRLENLLLRNKMLKSLSVNGEFIMVEDDNTEKVKQYIPDDVHYFYKNSGLHNKNHAYNLGAKIATRDYMVFLDADCIAHPRIWAGLVKNIKDGNLDGDNSLIYPYNRCAMYMSPSAKQKLKNNFKYETLENEIAPPPPLLHGTINH